MVEEENKPVEPKAEEKKEEEEKKPEGEQEEKPKEETPEANPLVEAKRLRDELKELSSTIKTQMDRFNEAKAFDILSGNAPAGQGQQPKKEETASEYVDKAIRGELNEKDIKEDKK